MRGPRRHIFFLAMVLFSVSLSFVFFHAHIENSISVLTRNAGTLRYEAVGTGELGLCAAAGWNGERIQLRVFDLDGKLRNSWSAPLPDEAGGAIDSVYPCKDDVVFLGIYGRNAETLSLYRLRKDAGAELLLRESCPGRFTGERMEGTRLSSLTEADGKISFALLSGNEIKGYLIEPERGGLDALGTQEGSGIMTALMLADGKTALGGRDFLVLEGRPHEALPPGQLVTALVKARIGWYYMDASALEVYFSDLGGTTVQRLYALDPVLDALPEDFRVLTDLVLTGDGRALLLAEGTMLLLADESGVTRLDGVLTYGRISAALRLVGDVLAALLAAFVLWFAVCGVRRGYTSMAVTWGGILIALTTASVVVLIFGVLHPSARQSAISANATVVDAAGMVVSETLTTVAGDSGENVALTRFEEISDILCLVLESAWENDFHNVHVFVTLEADGRWYLPDGRRAEMEPNFDLRMNQAAISSAHGNVKAQKDDAFGYVLREENVALNVYFEGAATLHSEETERILIWRAAVICFVSILILILVSRDLRLLAKEMERLSAGGTGARLRIRTGDELESMAATVSGLGESLEKQKLAQEALARSSRRFVPEQVLSLLGKQSIEEVDKDTLTVRRMAVMAVRFYFPKSLYSDAGKSHLLFSAINRVIERTAPIATEKGGTVFNYSYFGYEVVMEQDSGKVVSTAVAIQQEILSLNEEQAREGQPQAVFRIALDKGDVLAGIVGDSEQMEPTMISSSFATVNSLLGIARRLEARILCTEAIIGQAADYGSRYMGKCRIENVPVRVYEIFDGDEYDVRKGKAATVERFSAGVYALYGGDTAQAKRAFLDLARDNPEDGGVRYYLYLADRMERNPELICSLDPPERNEREE